MVVLNIVKLSAGGGGFNVKLPGLSRSTLKKYPSLMPLHFFTGLGCAFAAWYCYRLLAVKDCILLKNKEPKEIKPTDRVILLQKGDFSKLEKPANKPDLPVYHHTRD